jgi:hypothetical protein
MERDPSQPTTDDTQPPEESPPPFEPDPRLFAHLERGGNPSTEEIRQTIDRAARTRG